MDKEEIRRLIAKGRIDKALDKLIEEINQIEDAQTKNDLILQSGRLKRIYRDKNLGTESGAGINITINQITQAVLSILDEVDDQTSQPEEKDLSVTTKKSERLLLSELSTIIGQAVKTIPEAHRDQILHQLELYKINRQNLDNAEKAAAKWGELAPPIILHRISDEKEKIGQVINQLKMLL